MAVVEGNSSGVAGAEQSDGSLHSRNDRGDPLYIADVEELATYYRDWVRINLDAQRGEECNYPIDEQFRLYESLEAFLSYESIAGHQYLTIYQNANDIDDLRSNPWKLLYDPDEEVARNDRGESLSADDVAHVALMFVSWRRLHFRKSEIDISPAEEEAVDQALLELEEYRSISGKRLAFNFSAATSIDDIFADPWKVVEKFDCIPPVYFLYYHPFFHADTCQRGAFLDCHELPPDCREKCAEHHARKFDLIVWRNWPKDEPGPLIGVCEEEYWKKYYPDDDDDQPHPGDDCNFADDHHGAITNEDPEHLARIAAGKVGDNEADSLPANLTELLKLQFERFRGWPRSVGGELFVRKCDKIHYLESKDSLFSWYAEAGKCLIQWREGSAAMRMGFVSQSQFFISLKRNCKNYNSIEFLPHEPPMTDAYYLCKAFAGDGSKLERFLDFFLPETPVDRQLIKAMLATAFWGGPGGARPAFLIDATAGRGCGKSKLAHVFADLSGGSVDVSDSEDIAVIKQRLLTPGARSHRVALLDNVKSRRFSFADLEALITANVISGKQMWTGNSDRANTITWVITLNGASLSTDLAQRIVNIKLARPPEDPDLQEKWDSDIERFVSENHAAIVADLISFLRVPPIKLARYSRWSTWESQVLSKCDEPNECMEEIIRRRQQVDVEHEEVEIIEEFFINQLISLSYSVSCDRVHLPTQVVCNWFNEATRERSSATSVSRQINQMINEGTITRLKKNPRNGFGRGFIWEPKEAKGATHYDIEERILHYKREEKISEQVEIRRRSKSD